MNDDGNSMIMCYRSGYIWTGRDIEIDIRFLYVLPRESAITSVIHVSLTNKQRLFGDNNFDDLAEMNEFLCASILSGFDTLTYTFQITSRLASNVPPKALSSQ